jgi:hypothetical protein
MTIATMSQSSATPSHVDPRTLEKVLAEGDLSKLNTAERLAWYKARCDAAGLDFRTQPFQYIVLKGKLTLYATKSATDQLIANRKLSISILDRRYTKDTGLYEVHCAAKFPDGQSAEDVGAVYAAGLKGEEMANAIMKAITKAKRRTVLSACGLGALDESEVDTIPGARKVPAQIGPDEPEPFHPTEEEDDAAPVEFDSFGRWRDAWVKWGNEWWKSRVGDKPIYVEHPVIVVKFQLQGHICKFANERGWTRLETKDFHRPETGDELTDVLEAHREEMDTEAERYIRSLPKKLQEKLQAKLDRQLKAKPVEPSDGRGDAYEEDLDEAGQSGQEQDMEQAVESNLGED